MIRLEILNLGRTVNFYLYNLHTTALKPFFLNCSDTSVFKSKSVEIKKSTYKDSRGLHSYK